MKERPILFSGEMVKAILEGRKSQTRRIIDPQPLSWCTRFEKAPFKWANGFVGEMGDWLQMTQDAVSIRGLGKCRYGMAGDYLWVRETWATVKTFDHLKPKAIPKGDKRWPQVWYAADPGAGGLFQTSCEFVGKTRPSIFMPRWASRLTLEVVNVRVERVQSISYADARAEGMPCNYHGDYDFLHSTAGGYISNYRRLWNQLNKGRGFGWDANPWVWVIEFKKIEVK